MTRTILNLCVCTVMTVTFSACENGNLLTSSDESDSSVAVIPANVDASSTITDIQADNAASHEDLADYTWDIAQVIPVVFNGNSITETSDNVAVSGAVATITGSGTYSFSGTSDDGQIVVDVADENDEGTVRLVLNGISLTSTTTSPIYVNNAEKAVIVLTDGTQNSITDGSSYVFPDSETDEPNAAVFSKADLTITGGGALTVNGNYNDGIASKDGLIIDSGVLDVTSADDGIRGKDYLIVKNGVITVTSAGNGLKSDNDEDVGRGYIAVESGTLHITSADNAISAASDVLITNGQFSLTSSGGSSSSSSSDGKGIKGTVCVVIEGGAFTISSANDAIHSNSAIVIHDGTFDISSGDDGIHADSLLAINSGTFDITKSYEGLESISVVINGGNIHLVASDDGINGAGGNDGSGAGGWPGPPGHMQPGAGNASLVINGGYIYVNATGDGLDVNGTITMTGGTVLINGPTTDREGPVDYDTSFKMTGGFLVATGSSGMAQAPSSTSTQYSLLLVLNSAKSANTLFHLQASDGADIATFAPVKPYQSIAICSPDLTRGTTYSVYFGGSSTGTATDGLYSGGTYSGGTASTSFSISNIITAMRI